MSKVVIQQLFEARVQVWAAAQIPPVPVVYENVESKEQIFVDCYILPTRNIGLFLEGGSIGHKGIFQIEVNASKGFGSGQANRIAQSIVEYFPENLEMTSGEIVVVIDEPPTIEASVTTERRFILPVSISYRSDVT